MAPQAVFCYNNVLEVQNKPHIWNVLLLSGCVSSPGAFQRKRQKEDLAVWPHVKIHSRRQLTLYIRHAETATVAVRKLNSTFKFWHHIFGAC